MADLTWGGFLLAVGVGLVLAFVYEYGYWRGHRAGLQDARRIVAMREEGHP